MENFIAAIKKIDALQENYLPKDYTKNFAKISEVCNQWTLLVRNEVRKNRSLLDETNLDEVKALVQANYPDSYIFPSFTAYIHKIKKIPPPVRHGDKKSAATKGLTRGVEQEDFTKFLSKLKKLKNAARIEEAVDNFKSMYTNEDGLHAYIDNHFKPRHPVYYSLRNKEKEIENTIDVETKSLVLRMLPFLELPQLYARHEYLLAFQVASGMSAKELLGMNNEISAGEFKIRYSTDGENIERYTLCPSRILLQGLAFIKAQKIALSNAVKPAQDVPEKVLGITDFSYRTIPSLYASLVKHFFSAEMREDESSTSWKTPNYQADENSVFTFRTIGLKSIDLILAEWQTRKSHSLTVALKAQDEKVKSKTDAALDALTKDPTTKINVANLKKLLRCSTEDASAVRNTLEAFAKGVLYEQQ